jgi:hypothetical protein
VNEEALPQCGAVAPETNKIVIVIVITEKKPT